MSQRGLKKGDRPVRGTDAAVHEHGGNSRMTAKGTCEAGNLVRLW